MLTTQTPKRVAYLVLDIRDSNRLNKYVKSFYGDEKLIEFYTNFTKTCSNIAIKKNNAWFSKQIGDRLDFAWNIEDIDKAISTAVEIYEVCNKSFSEYYPNGIKLGIGIATGPIVHDKQYNELKGDCPRLATILQEKKSGMFISVANNSILSDEYTLIPVPAALRGEIFYSYQIVKRKHTKRQKALNTKYFLKQIEGLAQDIHSHIEGATLSCPEMIHLIDDSFNDIAGSKAKSENFKNVTGKEILDIKKSFVDKIYGSLFAHSTFTFDEFLSKLFTAKACLASNEKNAYKFVKLSIKNILENSPTFSLGLTPSVPSDFSYLNRDKWNKEVCKAFKEALTDKEYLAVRPTFVMETKRQHLQSDVYKQNLDFLAMLKEEVPQLQLSLGICDNAEKFPIVTSEVQKKFEDFVECAQKIDPAIQIQIHEMEQYHKPNPLQEFNYLLDYFDSKKINGVTWIHLCYLNSKAGVVTRDQTERILNRIADRNDRIVSCISSNRYLGNPFILDDELAYIYLLSERINWTIGTDDPYPFNVTGIVEEMKILYNHFIRQYKDIEMAEKAFRIFSQNSWKQWDVEQQRWILEDKKTFGEPAGIEKVAFLRFFEYQALGLKDV